MSVITTDRGGRWTGDAGLSHFDGSLNPLKPGALLIPMLQYSIRGRQMGRKSANMDTFLPRLDAKAPMGPLCGASKARAAQ